MGTIIVIVLIVGLFFLMFRSNKKQERETAEMRNNLEVGDEITTIGGIIGEIVKIKEETVTIETGKDRTKIRILRSAVRVVDVHAYEKRGDGKKPVNTAPAASKEQASTPIKMEKLQAKSMTDESSDVNTSNGDDSAKGTNATKRKRGKKKNDDVAVAAENASLETDSVIEQAAQTESIEANTEPTNQDAE